MATRSQALAWERVKRLSLFCTKNGWQHEIIKDLGSGMNYNKKGLRRLLDMILENQIKRLVLTHKDRLLRFGSELVFALCEARQVEVVKWWVLLSGVLTLPVIIIVTHCTIYILTNMPKMRDLGLIIIYNLCA